MRKPFLIIWLALLVALSTTQKNAIAAEKSVSDKSTVCNTDEARKSAKLWDYDPVDAYEFGLKIQHFIEQKDLQSLFGLVKGELRYGPRKKYIQGKIFLKIFSEKWRETVLSEKPECTPVGWRGFMMGHGKIWYEKNDETNEWEIISIHADQKIEQSKTPVIGGWNYKGKLLTSDCFSTMWVSGDNYQYYEEKYGGDKGVDFRDFLLKPGKFIGGPIPIVPIVPQGDEFTSAEEWLLAPKLSSCQKYPVGVGNITNSGGWISKQYCFPESPDRCLKYSYGLIRQISLDHCHLLAPNFPDNCIDLGLVQVSKETGGSMGNDVQEGIYGIVEDPVSGENYMVPLINFSSLNEALNYVDRLDQDTTLPPSLASTTPKVTFQKGIQAYEKKDYETAMRELKPLAEQGDARAQFMLGEMYHFGMGVSMDSVEAIRWLRTAADQGDPDAAYRLGVIYSRGHGFPMDLNEAAKWYQLAINRGNTKALYDLGEMHYRAGDYKEALKWLRSAAEQGNASSAYILGGMFASGLGVAEDGKAAVKWYALAAEQGNASAQNNLGQVYYNGEGVPQDYKAAIKWFNLAAEQGNAKAQFNLGLMYENGLGIQKNFKTAVKWYTLAAEQGDASARTNLARMANKNTQTASPSTTNKVVPTAPPFPSSPIDVRFRASQPSPDDVAVIIGNADYTEGKDIPNVIPAYADAEGIRNYVTQALGIAEDNIIFLKDATQKDLIGTFGSETNHKGRLSRYLTPNESNVFVFYSGHGAPGDGDTNYLVPTDAEASLINLNGYSLKTLYQNLSKLPAKSVTVVLEACFSGASEAGTVINNASPIYLKAKNTGIPSNITVIAAGAANQIASWEQDKSNGLFTKYFLKGMSGEADNDNDRKVSWAELRDYLAETVTRSAMRNYGREQTPQIVVGTGG